MINIIKNRTKNSVSLSKRLSLLLPFISRCHIAMQGTLPIVANVKMWAQPSTLHRYMRIFIAVPKTARRRTFCLICSIPHMPIADDTAIHIAPRSTSCLGGEISSHFIFLYANVDTNAKVKSIATSFIDL